MGKVKAAVLPPTPKGGLTEQGVIKPPMIDKKYVMAYLKKKQDMNKIAMAIEGMESEMKQHFGETGDTVLANILQVTVAKNPAKLVALLRGGEVTTAASETLLQFLGNSQYVKTSTTLEAKKIHEAKNIDNMLRIALEKAGLDTEQSTRIEFKRLVK